MNEGEPEPVIRRILVALDASPHSLAALETAARLAGLFGAELLGIYVEDIDLLRAGALPFARETALRSGACRRVDTEHIERELRSQATLARRALTESAGRAQVRWSFRISRGTVVSELIMAASQMDLVILGKSGWSPVERRRLGSTARALLSTAPGAALVLEHGTNLHPPLAVVCDGSALGRKALNLAATLSEREGSHLILLALAEDPREAARIRDQCSLWLRGRGVLARYYIFNEWIASHVAETLVHEKAGGIVVPATEAVFREDQLVTLLGTTDTPVLIVR